MNESLTTRSTAGLAESNSSNEIANERTPFDPLSAVRTAIEVEAVAAASRIVRFDSVACNALAMSVSIGGSATS